MSEFTYHRQVQFADTDMAGVMHFSNYFRVMEEAETAFWRSLGLCVHNSSGPDDISWPRVAVSCEYHSPARFQDNLAVRVRVEALGPKSASFRFEITRDGQRLASGAMKAVCCAMRDGRFQSVPIPDEVRASLSRSLAE